MIKYYIDMQPDYHREFRNEGEITYPDSDGAPMAESDFQLEWLLYFVQTLKAYFLNRTDIYAAGNMFIYFEKGNPQAVVAPDVFVIRDVENKRRHSYKTWEEGGKTPDFVIEITSKTTALVDQTAKRGMYTFLEVEEYIQFDPTQDYLSPAFQFFRLVDQAYQIVKPLRIDDGVQVYWSNVLNLELHYFESENEVRLFDAQTQAYFGTLAEERAALNQARQDQLIAEEKAIEAVEKAAEAEGKAMEAEQKATQAQQEATQAEQKATQAQQEATQAEQKATQAEQRASEAESMAAEKARENEALKAELRRLRDELK